MVSDLTCKHCRESFGNYFLLKDHVENQHDPDSFPVGPDYQDEFPGLNEPYFVDGLNVAVEKRSEAKVAKFLVYQGYDPEVRDRVKFDDGHEHYDFTIEHEPFGYTVIEVMAPDDDIDEKSRKFNDWAPTDFRYIIVGFDDLCTVPCDGYVHINDLEELNEFLEVER